MINKKKRCGIGFAHCWRPYGDLLILSNYMSLGLWLRVVSLANTEFSYFYMIANQTTLYQRPKSEEVSNQRASYLNKEQTQYHITILKIPRLTNKHNNIILHNEKV